MSSTTLLKIPVMCTEMHRGERANPMPLATAKDPGWQVSVIYSQSLPPGFLAVGPLPRVAVYDPLHGVSW